MMHPHEDPRPATGSSESTQSADSTHSTHSTVVSRRRMLAIAGGAVLLGACSGSDDESTETVPESTPAPTTTPTTALRTTTTTAAPTTTAVETTTTIPETTTTVAPAPVYPLTGLPLDDLTILNRVALVVKISNDKGARPQTGLNDADIVFEAWGAGPTRFATVWHSRDQDFVGPIRSCREQDVNLVGSFNGAVFACSGGNPGNIRLIQESDMLLVTEGRGPGWQLDPNRKRPHKTHANTAFLRSNAGPERVGPIRQYEYRAVGEAATAGDPMTGIDLQIQSNFVEWRYDVGSGSYLRSQARKPHLLADGAQVTTENVIVAFLDYEPSTTDGRSPDGRTTGENAALVFTGGRMQLVRWSRTDRLQPFQFTGADGGPARLTPGRTFFELANNGFGSFRGIPDSFTLVP